jgi:hypothetical protein
VLSDLLDSTFFRKSPFHQLFCNFNSRNYLETDFKLDLSAIPSLQEMGKRKNPLPVWQKPITNFQKKGEKRKEPEVISLVSDTEEDDKHMQAQEVVEEAGPRNLAKVKGDEVGLKRSKPSKSAKQTSHAPSVPNVQHTATASTVGRRMGANNGGGGGSGGAQAKILGPASAPGIARDPRCIWCENESTLLLGCSHCHRCFCQDCFKETPGLGMTKWARAVKDPNYECVVCRGLESDSDGDDEDLEPFSIFGAATATAAVQRNHEAAGPSSADADDPGEEYVEEFLLEEMWKSDDQ